MMDEERMIAWQEVENSQRFGTVLAADKLAFISEVREVLRLNDDAQAFLLHSALQVGHDVEYWLNRIPELTRRVELLTQAAQNKLTIVRQRAAETLGTQDVPQSVEPLLTLALHDPNMDVRDTARQSLAQLTKQQIAIVERLKGEIENPTSSAAALRTLTYLPLSGLPFSLRTQVLMMRIRLRMTSLIEASLATPQRRAMAMTTGLLVVLVVLAYAFSANAYYVDIRLSNVLEGEDVIVIRRGHPLLKFPGLSQVLVDTGIQKYQIANDGWTAIRNEQLWGLSSQTSPRDFYKWGQDVADTLNLEDRASMLWYLGQQEEAFQAILEAMSSQDTELQVTLVRLLEQIVKVDPQLAEGAFNALEPLLKHKDWLVSYTAVSTVGQMAEANPQLAEEVLQALLPLLEHEDSDIGSQAVSAVGQVVEANPQLAEQVIAELLPLLEDELSNPAPNISSNAISMLGEVLAVNRELAQLHIKQLVNLLSNPEPNISSNAAYSLGEVLAANPELAQQHIEQLIDLLSHQDSYIASSALSSFGKVLAVNRELAQQHIEQLIDLLSHQDSYIASRALSSFGEVLVANPELAQQHIEQLIDLLSHQDSYIASSALSSFGEVLVVNRELAQQHIEQLLDLLSHQDSDITSRALSSLGEVLASNLQLAKDHIDSLNNMTSHQEPSIAIGATESVAQVLAANPELAQPHIDSWFDLPLPPEISVSQAESIKQVLAANPELVQPQHIEKLVILFSKDQEIGNNLAPVVGKIVANNSLYASQVIEPLQKQLENSRTHSNAVLVLAHAYIHQEPSSLLKKLTDPRNTLERPVAARALFLITLQKPSRNADIRKELQKLSNSPEPMERIWANKTLAMLDFASQAHEAAELDDKQRKGVTDKLQGFTEWDSSESTPNFFGKDFIWAAGEAHNWLEEQTNEEKAE